MTPRITEHSDATYTVIYRVTVVTDDGVVALDRDTLDQAIADVRVLCGQDAQYEFVPADVVVATPSEVATVDEVVTDEATTTEDK